MSKWMLLVVPLFWPVEFGEISLNQVKKIYFRVISIEIKTFGFHRRILSRSYAFVQFYFPSISYHVFLLWGRSPKHSCSHFRSEPKTLPTPDLDCFLITCLLFSLWSFLLPLMTGHVAALHSPATKTHVLHLWSCLEAFHLTWWSVRNYACTGLFLEPAAARQGRQYNTAQVEFLFACLMNSHTRLFLFFVLFFLQWFAVRVNALIVSL